MNNSTERKLEAANAFAIKAASPTEAVISTTPSSFSVRRMARKPLIFYNR